MAIILAKKNNVFNMQQRYFYIDSEADLDTLEATYDLGLGDIAETPNGTIYRRHSDGYDGELWEEKGASGGGGGGSTGGLPVVTAADNGDVLTVVNGAWAKATPSNGMPVVGIMQSGQDYVLINLSDPEGAAPTYAEISAAIIAGIPVQYFLGMDSGFPIFGLFAPILAEGVLIMARGSATTRVGRGDGGFNWVETLADIMIDDTNTVYVDVHSTTIAVETGEAGYPID